VNKMAEKITIQEQRIENILNDISKTNVELMYMSKEKYDILQKQLWLCVDTFIPIEYDTEITIDYTTKLMLNRNSLILKETKKSLIDYNNLRECLKTIINDKKIRLIGGFSHRIKSKFTLPPYHFKQNPVSFRIINKFCEDRESMILNHLSQILIAFSFVEYVGIDSKNHERIYESIFYQLNQYVKTGDIKTDKPNKLNTKKIPKPMIYLSDEGNDLVWKYSKFCTYCLENDNNCYCQPVSYGLPDKSNIYLDYPCPTCNKELIKRAFTENFNSKFKETDCITTLNDNIRYYIESIEPDFNNCKTEEQAIKKIFEFNRKHGKYFNAKLITEKYKNIIYYNSKITIHKIDEKDFKNIWKKLLEFYDNSDCDLPEDMCSCSNW